MDAHGDIKNLAIALSSSLLLLCWCGLSLATPASQALVGPVPATTTSTQEDTSPAPPDVRSLNDYLEQRAGPIGMSRLGIMVEDDSVDLDDGTRALGVAVLKVISGGPAAGVLECSRAAETVRMAALVAAGTAAAIMFPPALIGIALIGRSAIGESHDVIIGIDGYRVRNTVDLAQAVANDHPGDTVYLAIVRKGRRMLVHLRLP